jgi:Transglycosylase SLT domain
MSFPVAAVAGDTPALPAEASDAADTEAVTGTEASAPDEDAPPSDAVPSMDQPPVTEAPSAEVPNAEIPNASCLTRTICAIKDKIRWQTPAWTPVQCNNIAKAVLTSSGRYNISPSLLLAVMINESDLNEKASRPTVRNNRIYAQDSGLMAIRCVLDKRNRCLNGSVRGMSWKELMKPATNIELGAHELAYWRDGGAVMRTTVKMRGSDGRVRPVYKLVPCRHRDHGYWAHYNHGPMYIAHGYARHYPHRVAVLDHALATVLNVDAPELRGKITMHDAGRRERTVDHPLEPRYKKLCSQIESVGGCSAVAVN